MLMYKAGMLTDKIDSEYDVIIIGGSAAGLTAAIYTTRSALKTLVITKEVGGQITETPEIENYPGFESITGQELANRMELQAKKFGTVILNDEVTNISKEGDEFYVETMLNGKIKAKAVIIATGRSHRKLNVPGEKELAGKGVSYCVTCDGPFFKDRIVAVIGGGNSGFTAAEYLSKIAKKVYLIHRRTTFRADNYLVEKVKSLNNVEIVVPYNTMQIKGKDRVEGIVLENAESKETKELKVDAVFVEIGTVPNTKFLNGFVELNEYGEIKVNRLMETNVEGAFAAGDVTDNRDKQIAVAVGEGATAGLSVKEYLYEKERKGELKIIGL